MVKVSITLPNNAQITFESEEPEVIHEIVGMVLRDLPRELMQSGVHINGNGAAHSETNAGNRPGEIKTGKESAAPAVPDESLPAEASASRRRDPAQNRPGATRQTTDSEQKFVDFCQQANPLGDMRRVVVAAEGASRYLSRQSVSADELGSLFDLAGWQRPHSFVQTLRNAARTKFRWLERVPGRSGQYKVTDLGRRTAFSG